MRLRKRDTPLFGENSDEKSPDTLWIGGFGGLRPTWGGHLRWEAIARAMPMAASRTTPTTVPAMATPVEASGVNYCDDERRSLNVGFAPVIPSLLSSG